MRIDISARNGYFVRDKLNDLIEKKVGKLEKFFNKEVSAKVVCTGKGRDRYKMEVTIVSDGKIIRSEIESDNMYANLDACLARIERQIIKYSDKLQTKKRSELEFNFFDENDTPEIVKPKVVKKKVYNLDPISVEEATAQLDLVGNSFYMFLNSKTNEINVVYKREDGNIGLIEGKV